MTQDIFGNDPLQDNTFQHDMGMQGSNLDPNQYDSALHSTPDLQNIPSLNDPQQDNLPQQPLDLGGTDLGDLGYLGDGHLPDMFDWNFLGLGGSSLDDRSSNIDDGFDVSSLSHTPINPYDSSHLSPTSGDYSFHDGLEGIQNDGSHDPFARQVTFHSASAHSSPYTTINDDGWIYKHTPNDSSGDWVGTIENHKVYTDGRDYLGRAGLDGKVYDSHDHCIGWVDSNGHVYNEAGVEVYETTKGVTGAAAYLLFVYHGGVT